MNQNAIDKMKRKLKGSFVNTNVVDNWPQYDSFETHVTSLGDEVLKCKSKWIDIIDVFNIYYEVVVEALTANGMETPPKDGCLWDIIGEEKGTELINRFIDYIVTIPRTYDLFIPLPNLSGDLNNLRLSENFSLIVFNDTEGIPGGFNNSMRSLLSGLSQPTNSLEPNKVYLSQRVSGFCGNRIENFTIKEAINNFKIIIQLGMFKNIFVTDKPKRIIGGYSHFQIPKIYLVNVDKTDSSEKAKGVELPVSFSEYICSINYSHNNQEPSLLRFRTGEDIAQHVNEHLGNAINLIECDAEESKRVKASILWYFESCIASSPTLAFLQVCIGLEALLGDDVYNGALVETLADRCAYLISGDIKGRKKIKDDFKKIYGVRSKLVHGNATELDSNQKHYLHQGRSILKFAISKEIKHLNLDKNTSYKK
ncbi:MAG: hypothetical protein A2076_04560 [Geobacteraceae bacterium GWC2_53_11]|nr:MAG: hypothetical protein A2076_04560 [Geobacteraceae bacterium GWC2_53_11]